MIDNDLPPALALGLQAILPTHQICSLRQKFERSNVKDEEWIVALGNEGGWSVISADRRIARNPISRNAFLAAGLLGFFFSASLKRAPLRRQAAKLLTIWDLLEAQANLNTNGCFEIPTSGKKFRVLGR